MHEENCFVTLTYDSDSCPISLKKEDHQKFICALRERLRRKGKKMSYYLAGEYGKTCVKHGWRDCEICHVGRPHYHACLFGVGFADRKLLSRAGGNDLYRSAELESLWTHGYSSVADFSFETAAYVARYCMKKITGEAAEDHYEWVDPVDGEVCRVAPEYSAMSRRPAIGSRWFDRFGEGVRNHDSVVVRGRECKPPRYYDKKTAENYPERWEEIASEREKLAEKFADLTGLERHAREQVARARLQLKPRGKHT